MERSASQISQLETATSLLEGECVRLQLDQPEGLRVPSIFFNSQVPEEDSSGAGPNGIDNPGVADSTVVANNPGTFERGSSNHPLESNDLTIQ